MTKNSSFFKDEKGIVTIIGFVMFVILLVLFGYFMPLINEAIQYAKNNMTDDHRYGAFLHDTWDSNRLVRLCWDEIR